MQSKAHFTLNPLIAMRNAGLRLPTRKLLSKERRWMGQDFHFIFRKQNWLVMKLTAILLLSACLQVSATGFSQNVTLSEKSVSLQKVFKQIHKQTGYQFFYEDEMLNKAGRINITVKDAPLEKVLAICFKDLPLSYSIVNNAITVTPRKVAIVLQQQLPAINNIHGTVKDQNNNPLTGVSVIVKGTKKGTSTGADGSFNIDANVGDVLEFTMIGYKSKIVTVGQSSNITIEMDLEVTVGNEVVVVGYGTQKKTDLTGAISTISTKEFADQPVTRVDQVLQGRVAGVQVTNASGAPGADVRIRIRGANSVLGNNDPLYVVDGFVGADFSTINPDDIEAIQILKDASSTSIYGSRGANGVVIITTKKGKRGGFKITYDGQVSSSQVIKRYDLLSAYDFATIVNQRSVDLNTAPVYTQAQVDFFKTNPGTNWQDLVFRKSMGQQHNLSVSGGSEKTTYLLSANYLDQDGVINNTGFKKYSIRSNINSNPTDKLSIHLNIEGSRREGHNIGLIAGSGNPVTQAISWAPTTPARDSSGNVTLSDPVGSAVGGNPLALMYDQTSDANTNQANIIGGINYKLPIDGLAIDLQYGMNYANAQGAYYGGSIVTRGNPAASRNSTEQTTVQSTSSLTYNRTFHADHSINAVIVFETQKYIQNYFSSSSSNLFFPSLGYYNLALANSFAVGSGYTESAILSYLGRVNYAYKDKFLLTAAVRRDGASKFAPGNQYSTFPSVGVGYNLSKEDFVQKLNIFSNLKVRASWGITGSQAINPYATLSTYATGTPAAFNSAGVIYGIQLGNPGNLNLKWETTKQSDVGLEMGFLENRITLEADYFVKNTSNLLLNQALPAYVGGGTETKNVGSVQNKGYEFTLGTNLVKGKNFNWSSNFNFSFVKNRVKSLGGIAPRIPAGTGVGAGMSITNEFMIQPGYSLGSYWGLKYLGTWKPKEATEAATYNQKPGDSHYQDINGDGAINTSDFQIIGTGIPTSTLGWNNTFSYKALTLNVFVQGVFGIDKLNYTKAVGEAGAGDARQITFSEIKNRYIPGVNETSNIPAFSSTDVIYTQSSRFIENGSYLRVKNVSLAYNLPLPKKSKINIKVFVSATNLLTFTKYTGLDPESSNIGSSTDTAQGIDYGAYPNSRTYTFGINLSY